MKKIRALLFATAVLMTVNVFAQEETKTAPSLSVGVEGALPVGDLSNSQNFGIGASVKAAIPIFEDGYVTVSAGYIRFSGKDETFLGQTFKGVDINMIPLKAGIQYRFPGGFYIEPQLGYTRFSAKDADGTGAFTYAGNVGYLLNNMIDLSARYEASSRDGSTASFIGVRVAYSFSL